MLVQDSDADARLKQLQEAVEALKENGAPADRIAPLEKELLALQKEARIAALEQELLALKEETMTPSPPPGPPPAAESDDLLASFISSASTAAAATPVAERPAPPAAPSPTFDPFPSPETIGVAGLRCAVLLYAYDGVPKAEALLETFEDEAAEFAACDCALVAVRSFLPSATPTGIARMAEEYAERFVSCLWP